MPKRYTSNNDRYICEYFDAVPTVNLARDLGRTEASVKQRAAKLRAAGCFEHYRMAKVNSIAFDVLAGHMSAEDADLIHDVQVEQASAPA